MIGYKKQVDLPFDKAVARVREELAKEGFGILTEADVRATLKKKLNVEFEDYIILGACNPPFAHEALQVTKEVGLMMPCNVVVFVDKGKTFVEATTPTVLMKLIQDDRLKTTAEKIEAKLKKAVDSVR
jgi:uncharacterized protein (DUF302 family)